LPRPSSSAPLSVRLTWLAVFRTAAISLLLVVLSARLIANRTVNTLSFGDFTSFALIAISYGFTLVFGFLIRRRAVDERIAWLQVVSDVLVASAAVFLTNGADSPFSFVYLLAIIGASVLLFRRGAFAAASLSSVSYVSIVLALNSGLFGRVMGDTVRDLRQISFDLVTQLLAQWFIAVLAGYVAQQLSTTGGQLSARERDLRELSTLQLQIVTAMPSGLLTCDLKGLVNFVNPAAEAILGTQPEVLGREIEHLLPTIRRITPNTRRNELTVTTPNGERILGLTVSPLDPTQQSLLVVFQDLTHLRRLETELHRIDHLANLGRLSATLAHEVRNPLASMRGAAQMLMGDSKAGTHDERLSKLIVRESDRLAALVEDYLRLASPPPPTRTRRALDNIIRETVEMLRADPEFAMTQIELRLETLFADVDEGQMKQVLINLLRNAVTASRGQERVAVRLKASGSAALLEVWDGAGGIAPEDHERIFEPFFTTTERGTGLGLPTVRTIVQAHGGTIDVASARSTGTTFTIRFPLNPEVDPAAT